MKEIDIDKHLSILSKKWCKYKKIIEHSMLLNVKFDENGKIINRHVHIQFIISTKNLIFLLY